MKNVLLVAALAAVSICACNKANAQENTVQRPVYEPLKKNTVVYHHEIFAGYGALTSNDLFMPFVKSLMTIFTFGGYSEKNMSLSGSLIVGYKYRFNRLASLGATYTFGTTKGDAYRSDTFWGKASGSHHTFAVECDFRYLTRKIVTLYSTVGVGGTYAIHTLTPGNPGEETISDCFGYTNFHISLIGAKLGTYRAGGFVELGSGYKGVINFGAYVRF